MELRRMRRVSIRDAKPSSLGRQRSLRRRKLSIRFGKRRFERVCGGDYKSARRRDVLASLGLRFSRFFATSTRPPSNDFNTKRIIALRFVKKRQNTTEYGLSQIQILSIMTPKKALFPRRLVERRFNFLRRVGNDARWALVV